MDGPKEEELVPDKLARIEDPLEQAIHFLKPLQMLTPECIATHVKAYEIYSRKGKLLLMLQSIKRGVIADRCNPQFHICLIHFLQYVKDKGELSEPAKSVIQLEIKHIYQGKSALQLNEEFLTANMESLEHRLAGAKMMYKLDQSRQEEAMSLATSVDPKLKGLSIKNCIDVLEALCRGDLGKCEQEALEYQARCHKIFPHATAFIIPATQPAVNNGSADSPSTEQILVNGSTLNNES